MSFPAAQMHTGLGLEQYFSQRQLLSAISAQNQPLVDQILASERSEYVNYNIPYLEKNFVAFKEAVAFKESQGKYSVVNTLGYLGKYQFAKNTLKLLGVYDAQQFINSSKLQEDAFLAYTARNKWILRRDIKRYNGTIINGVKITESGILAAAHLAGAGNVKKYLRSKGTYHFSDAFGTTIDHYLKRFAGYDTSFIKANKHAIAAR